ncbi:MAG: hypothetical protein JW753_05180, partial [Dehalococcoidia bacterium]|nr:hypothetical protein [Dehalococcoidia bacterium]
MRQSRLGLWLLVPTVIVVIALTLFFYSTGTAHYLTPNHTIVGAIHIDSEVTWALCAGEYEIEREADGHDTIRMDGFSSAILPGTPVLPHRTYDILLPPDATNLNLKLEILSSRSRILEGTYDIKLSEPDAVLNACESVGLEPDLVNSKDVQDMRGWAEDAFFPNSPTTLISCSQMRSWKFVRVDFTPFQYNPLSKELSLTESVSIRIVFSRSEFELSQNLMTGGFMEDTAAQRFVNYAEAKYWYDGAKPEDIFQQSYDYVIVTTNAIESSSTKLSSFVAHKQSKGHSVLVVTEDDYGGLTGQAPNHKAEKIRKWLKDNYSALAIQFVLLIGNPSPYESGEGDIPMKMCHPESNNSLGAEQTPTDYFYADLTGNWDVDGDQYYGEWLHDYGYPTPVPGGVDFSPEVYVGRIPVYGSDYTTLDSILLKTIDYESEPSASIAWRRNALMPMCFNYSGYDGAQLAEQMKDDYLDATSFSSWRMYQQGSGACSLNSSFASEEELRGGTVVRDRWAGTEYGIVAWWGHGDATSAAVGYSGCWDGTLMNSTYSSSLDDTHPAFTFQCSCTNGYPENSSNLQYAILGNGGIGTVSATRTSWFNTGVGYGGFDGSTTNSGVCYEYVRGLVDESREDGAALYLAKAGMSPGSATRLANWYDFNLYGDPSVSIASATYNSVAVTVNTSGLVSSAPTTVHYVEGGATKTETTFGVWSGTVDQGSTLSIDSAVSLSPTERYNTTDTASWVVSGPAMYSVSYYHQWKPVVSVVTTGTVHTDLGNTNSATLTYYRYGSPGIYSVFDGHNFNDWIDA